MAHFPRLDVEPHQQFMRQGNADNLLGLARQQQTLAEGDKTRMITAHHPSHHDDGCGTAPMPKTNTSVYTKNLTLPYIQLTEAEDAFHIQESDLQIRPVWHHKQERIEAHILVCLLVYVPWKMLEMQGHQAGLGDEPRQVFRELSEITLVDVVLPTHNGTTLRKRCIGQPNQHQLVLLRHLGLNLPSIPEIAPV